jgi:hypothetical protein
MAVVDTIGDIVGRTRAACIGEECDVDEDILRASAFPVVNADDAAGEQVFYYDFIHGEVPLGFRVASIWGLADRFGLPTT